MDRVPLNPAKHTPPLQSPGGKPGAILRFPKKRTQAYIANDLILGRLAATSRDHEPYSRNCLRVFMLLVGHVRATTDLGFTEFQVSAPTLFRALGLVSNPTLVEVEGLMAELASVVIVARGQDESHTVRWFDVAQYDHQTHLLRLQLSTQLAPYLLNLKARFSTQYVRSALALRSDYGPYLYGVVRQFVNFAHRKEHVVPLDELLNALHVRDGIARRGWKDFNHDILQPAWLEIHTTTELSFRYKPIRVNGAKRGPVHGVCFYDVREDVDRVPQLGDGTIHEKRVPKKHLEPKVVRAFVQPLVKLKLSQVVDDAEGPGPLASAPTVHDDPHADALLYRGKTK